MLSEKILTYDVAIGCDHAGYTLHQHMLGHWKAQKLNVLDVGTHSCDAVDYPLYAQSLCEAVIQDSCNKGLLICNSGIGMAIASNRFSGVRAIWADRPDIVFQGRKHNNANILCVGAMWTNHDQLIELWQIFTQTPFDEAPRHERRVQMLDVISSKMV